VLILVTGSTGFIGSQLCRSLIEQGHTVRAFHRASSKTLALEGVAVERVIGDVLDPGSLLSAMRGVEQVFHTAANAVHWRGRAPIVDTIVVGTTNVLQAAREAGVSRVVYTSSLAALGVPKPGELLDERSLFNYSPRHFPYGYAKHLAEKEVLAATGAGLDCVIVSPASVFGPYDLNLVSGTLIVEVARRRIPALTRGGMNVVHIDDVVAGHLAAAARGRPGERYILGGENLRHAEIVRLIAEEVGVRSPRLELPSPLVRLAATAIDVIGPIAAMARLPFNGNALRLSTYRFYCDTSKARSELGLSEPRPFRQAVQEAVAWYRSNGYL
jgi:dihydroflavonol-4-reductase